MMAIITTKKVRSTAAVFLASSSRQSVAAISSFSFSLRDPNLLPIVSSSPGGSRETFDVVNPAATAEQIKDGSAVIASVYAMNRDEVKTAIERSAAALPSWRDKTTGSKRSQILNTWCDLVKENAHDLAKIMTLESGKPFKESQGEVAYGASFLEYYAAEAIRPTSAGGGTISPSPFASPDGSPRGKILAVQEAVGVTAMITPWNFPIAMITRKVGPALAAGCTAVVKPSDRTPLTAIAVRTLAERAGVPKDVFQLVNAGQVSTAEVGEEFCCNPTVRKISFTGSTRIGKLLMKMSSDTVKRLSLELGGNAPFIVFDDADIDRAVDAAIASKFRNAGQTCVCADRFIIHTSIEEEFVSKLREKVTEFQVGPGMESCNNMGPLISEHAVKQVKDAVDEALNEGGKCVIGGSPMPGLGPNFFQPTIVRNVNPKSKLWASETFGPVAAICTFETEDEAIRLANDTTLGLASYFCSRDVSRIFRVAGRLENGIIGINDGIISTASAPFGGVKESGFGREGSAAGIAEYLETKYMFLNS